MQAKIYEGMESLLIQVSQFLVPSSSELNPRFVNKANKASRTMHSLLKLQIRYLKKNCYYF